MVYAQSSKVQGACAVQIKNANNNKGVTFGSNKQQHPPPPALSLILCKRREHSGTIGRKRHVSSGCVVRGSFLNAFTRKTDSTMLCITDKTLKK